MRFYIETIGCQYNEYDALRLSNFLLSCGLEESMAREADTILILACSVRQTAVDRLIGRARNWIKAGKKVYITACMLEKDKKRLQQLGAKYFSEIDDLYTLLDLPACQAAISFAEGMPAGNDVAISGTPKTRNVILRKSDETMKRRNPPKANHLSKDIDVTSYKLKANSCNYVPIMSGCNNFCSYCVVPYTRGREKSRPMGEIIEEVKAIIKRKAPTHSGRGSDRSVGKIILLGQNVNSYKLNQKSKIKSQNCNLKSKSDFSILLEAINNLPGYFKISFMSNHPKDLTEDIIEAVSKLPKVEKEIHLPLQSGSDKILKLMNRPYTVAKYLRLVKSLKSKVHNVKISTDIIVGFPGETEKDFQKTVEICKKIKFRRAYINKYSPRPGTAAHNLGDPISWSEKQSRWRKLNTLINRAG
jgi:tRNA-2-methylthio-N6-dimethylallyladenosine synthase